MKHMLLKFFTSTISLVDPEPLAGRAHALPTFVFQYHQRQNTVDILKTHTNSSQSPYRRIRQLPELSTMQKNNKEVYYLKFYLLPAG